MAFTPSNRVYLLDTPLDNTYSNQLRFSSRSAQQNYFKSCKVAEIDDIDYIRKDNVIIAEGQLDDYWRCNYVMYRNDDFNDRWFYAFITRMEWKSERSFAIYIETDVYQTWMLDCDILDSFVVREHVSDDTIGKHLVEEGLELGEYVMNDYRQTHLLDEIWYGIALSDVLGSNDTVVRNVYGGVYSGVMYKVYASTDNEMLTELITNYVNAGKADAIQFIFTIPKKLLPSGIASGDVIPSYSDFNLTEYNYPTYSDGTKFKELGGYQPINNKLYTYPYNFLYVSNNNGQCATYRFEDFKGFVDSQHLTFELYGNLAPNPTAMIIPVNYRQQDADNNPNMEHGLQMTGFPLCSWSNDTFNAWLAQNATQLVVTGAGGAVAMGTGLASGNLLAVAGGASAIFKEMLEIQKASIQPDSARGNINGGSVNIAWRMQDFFFSRMSVKYEYAERIDKYFTMFGYKVNMLKVPCTKSRKSWNYVKTVDINITGHIPSDDMRRLKQIYNDGVTLWHDPVKFCSYNYDNSIV